VIGQDPFHRVGVVGVMVGRIRPPGATRSKKMSSRLGSPFLPRGAARSPGGAV